MYGRDLCWRVGSSGRAVNSGTCDHGILAAGRWAAVGVRGKTPDRRVAFVSVYRPPGSLGGVEGSLVNRYGRLYKLSVTGLIHAKFYEDLSRWLARLRADGFEVVVGGDWNADLDRDRHSNQRGGGDPRAVDGVERAAAANPARSDVLGSSVGGAARQLQN